MDILSLAANVIAVVDAAATVAQKLERLRSFQGAPDQLLQVINEISDIRTIFVVVQQTCVRLEFMEANGQDDVMCVKLRRLLFQAETNFKSFDEIVQRMMPDTKNCNIGRFKFSWRFWMRDRTSIQMHVTALRSINRNILEVLATLQVSNIPKVHIRMADIIHGQSDTRRTFSSVQSSMKQMQHTSNNIISIGQQLRDMQESLNTLTTSSSTSDKRQNSFACHSQVVRPVIRIPTIVHGQKVCGKLCMCRCHETKTLSNPPWIRQFIGTLFVGYAAVPTPSPASCDEKMCKQQQSPLITVNYYFPPWLLRRAFLLRSSWSPTDGCVISVRTPRIVSATSPQILFAQNGNVFEMQRLFSKGLASPFDIDDTLGASSLQWAVMYKHANMCRFLLSQHADIYYTDRNSISCIGYVWRLMNTGALSDSGSMAIKEVFMEFQHDYHSVSQEFKFTVLHQIVLGMTQIDLRTQLSVTTAKIDTQCCYGRTPLMWATVRSDLVAMQLLLEFGASLDIAEKSGRNVFQIAAREPSIEPLKLLLKAISTSPALSNEEQQNHHARLINHFDIYGMSPLCIAIGKKQTHKALLLLQSPYVNVNPTLPAVAPLLLAIQHNEHEILRCLLKRGASTDCVDHDQMGILHNAGGAADLETILILLNYEAPLNVSVTHTDVHDDTPMQCFEAWRKLYVAEDDTLFAKSREAFEKLLNKANMDQLERLEQLEM